MEPPAWAPKQGGMSGQYPDLTVRATSCYHSASKEIWLGLGLRYERVTMLIRLITRVSVRYGEIFHEPKASEISRHISQLTSVISALFL